jgi:hypothetical protein
VPHDFPSHHTDFLEQFINYRVPVEMYSTLAEFDGSVIAERTKGELSARCGDTSMNFVALNLAHDARRRRCYASRDVAAEMMCLVRTSAHRGQVCSVVRWRDADCHGHGALRGPQGECCPLGSIIICFRHFTTISLPQLAHPTMFPEARPAMLRGSSNCRPSRESPCQVGAFTLVTPSDHRESALPGELLLLALGLEMRGIV